MAFTYYKPLFPKSLSVDRTLRANSVVLVLNVFIMEMRKFLPVFWLIVHKSGLQTISEITPLPQKFKKKD